MIWVYAEAISSKREKKPEQWFGPYEDWRLDNIKNFARIRSAHSERIQYVYRSKSATSKRYPVRSYFHGQRLWPEEMDADKRMQERRKYFGLEDCECEAFL